MREEGIWGRMLCKSLIYWPIYTSFVQSHPGYTISCNHGMTRGGLHKTEGIGVKGKWRKTFFLFFNNLQKYNLDSLSSQQPLVESIYCKSRYKIFNLVLKSSNILVFLLLLKWWKLMTAKFLLQICINDSLFLFQHFNNITTYKPNVLTYKYAVALFD